MNEKNKDELERVLREVTLAKDLAIPSMKELRAISAFISERPLPEMPVYLTLATTPWNSAKGKHLWEISIRDEAALSRLCDVAMSILEEYRIASLKSLRSAAVNVAVAVAEILNGKDDG